MFEKLQVVERLCKILLDEIHIKPGVQYYVEHLLGHSVDDPQKSVKIVLDLMVTSLMDKPAFAARFISIFSVKAEF